MPLRDHFHPPLSRRYSWEGFHGCWPAEMVRQIGPQLPANYVVEPRVHLGSFFEIDVSTYKDEDSPLPLAQPGSNGGAATTYAPPAATLVVDADIPDQYEYEVLIYNVDRERELVAAVEIVSPANKDRPQNRQVFVAKCASLLQRGVCVSMVDLVAVRQANLYVDLLALIDANDPKFAAEASATYAATCRWRSVGKKGRLETWSHALRIGQPLPKLPIWLTQDLAVSLDLEACYEETCRVLRIT